MTMTGVVNNYGAKTGFLVWELMIGNTNTRFHWGQTVSRPAIAEPGTPFQGTIYPDGHPWQIIEIQALTCRERSAISIDFRCACKLNFAGCLSLP
jgi:hypothetical protein